MGRTAHFWSGHYPLFLARLKRPYSTVYNRINLLLTVVLPAYSMLQGQTTIFYIMYLYWWHEFIASLLGGWYLRTALQQNKERSLMKPMGARLFLLVVYFVFIVVFFGFMTSVSNDRIMEINLKAFFLREPVFIINLAGLMLNEWWLRHSELLVQRDMQDPFSGRMLVMHLSIILGAVLQFSVVNKFSQLFTPNNLWGPVVVCLPFLLLKVYMNRRMGVTEQQG